MADMEQAAADQAPAAGQAQAASIAVQLFQQIPIFTGEKTGDVEEWLNTVNYATALLDAAIMDNARVNLLRLRMAKTAAKWASMLLAEQTATMAAFLQAIRMRFITDADRARASEQFYDAKQGESERVLDYLARVQRLATRVPDTTQNVITGIFKKGLHPEIRGMMELCTYDGLTEMIRAAESCECLMNENPLFQVWHSQKKPAGSTVTPAVTNLALTLPHANVNDSMEIDATRQWNKHNQKKCYDGKSMTKKVAGSKCWNCSGFGHVAK